MADREKSIDSAIASINKKMGHEGGRPVISKGSDFRPPKIIPCSSPMLGWAVGTGGWVEGKLHEIFGKEASGKTSLMYLGLKDCYEFYDGKRGVALIDLEHRFNPDWANKLGLDVDKIEISQPPSAESATDVMHQLIEDHHYAAIGFDSIGAAASSKEHMAYADQAAVYGGASAVMSRNVKTIAPLANYYDTTCIYVNQLRADLQGYNRPVTPGGFAVKHMMSIRIYIRPGNEKFHEKDEKGDEYQVGNDIWFKVVKNSFGPASRVGATRFFYFPSQYQDHVGFDIEGDIQTLGLLTHVFERSGAWYQYGDVRGQGREKFFVALDEAGLKEKVLAEIRARLSSSMPSYEDTPVDDISDPEI